MYEVARKRGWGDAWAYDGQMNLYAARDLLPTTRSGEVENISLVHKDYKGREEEFLVKIRLQGELAIKSALDAFASVPNTPLPADALAALDTVARQRRASQPASWRVAGRNLVSAELVRALGAGLEVWMGYSLSVRPTIPSGGSTLASVVDRYVDCVCAVPPC